MCICLGRVSVQEAKNIVHPDYSSATPKDLSLRELAFYYTMRRSIQILKEVAQDFKANKEIAKEYGTGWKGKGVEVLLDSLDLTKRIFEATTFLLRYSLGVIHPALVFRSERVAPISTPPTPQGGDGFDLGPFHVDIQKKAPT